MSTVRCSYCYEKGHNRLGCPKRRKYVQENPDSYEARKWNREQEIRQRAVESRKCSYCSEPGHNRRGCPTLKQDKAKILKRQKTYRDQFSQMTSSVGIAPGALVKVPHGNRNEDIWSKWTLNVVTRINWPEVDFTLQDCDISDNWSDKDRKIVVTRVVSAHGFDQDEDNYWNTPPKFNDVGYLTALQLSTVMEDMITHTKTTSDHRDWNEIAVVGHVHNPVRTPSDVMNFHLDNRFNLNPGPRADEYSKARANLAKSIWSKIETEKHLEAKQARADRGW